MRHGSKIAACVACAVIALLSFVLSGCATFTPSPRVQPHLISEGEQNPVRYIDSLETEALPALPNHELSGQEFDERLDALYSIVVEHSRKPEFAEDDPVEATYAAAYNIANRYILNDMTQKERAHAFHDYLVYYINYDYELYDSYLNPNSTADYSHHRAFNIAGVFQDGVAVCDGLVRAYNFLLALEGIRGYRIEGAFVSGNERVSHAWNKIGLSSSPDSTPIWYQVDITMDMVTYTVNGKRAKEMAHGYFLVSDSSTARTHLKDSNQDGDYICNDDYDCYTNSTITIDGRQYGQTVTSQQQLNDIFAAVSRAGNSVGKIELKLAFPNVIANTYERCIEEAYKQVPDHSLSIDSRPYLSYPNGVYFFIIYT